MLFSICRQKAHVCALWRHAAWPEGPFRRMTKQARVLDEAQNGDLVLIPCVQNPFSPLLLFSSSLVPSLFVLYGHFLPAFLHGFPGPPSPSIPLWVGGRLNGHVWVQRGQMKEWLTHGEGGWGGRAAARSFREWGIPCKVPEVEWPWEKKKRKRALDSCPPPDQLLYPRGRHPFLLP